MIWAVRVPRHAGPAGSAPPPRPAARPAGTSGGGSSGAPVRATVPGDILRSVRERAEAAYPTECCGILIGEREGGSVMVRRELPCPNVAPPDERRHRFLIEPGTVLDVMRSVRHTGEEMVGFYHSHPDAEAEPSATDLTFVSLWPETLWLIVPVRSGNAGDPRGWWLPLYDREGTPLEVRLEAPAAPRAERPAGEGP